MTIELEGGCRVTGFDEGEAFRSGTLTIRCPIGRGTGTRAISLRIIEASYGLSPGMMSEGSDEALYLRSGHGTAWIDGREFPIDPDTALYVQAGANLTLRCDGEEPLVLIGARCPDPGVAATIIEPLAEPGSVQEAAHPDPVIRLADVPRQATADRWYCELIDPKLGSLEITQFVGSIPPGRAPDHFHRYEEALFILEGTGRMWAGETSTPIGPGSCIFLPYEQVHCVENTGEGNLLLLGVFYPAGSPAVRYAPGRAGS